MYVLLKLRPLEVLLEYIGLACVRQHELYDSV